MAKVVGPLFSQDASGKVSRIVFSSWRALRTVRMLVTPTNPRTAAQLLARNYLATCSTAWGSLTAANRLNWETWAAQHPNTDSLGTVFTESGINAFVGLTTGVLATGGTQNDDPPVASPPATILAITQTPDDLGVDVIGMIWTWTYTGTPSADDFNDLELAGPFTSAGKRASNSDYRHQSFVAGNVGGGTLVSLIENSWYWLRLSYIDQYGQRTVRLVDQFQAHKGTA